MAKKVKKKDIILIDENKGHLFLGEAKKDLRLLMLRPIDLIEFSEFAGTNSEDIIIWIGKTLAKYFVENLYPEIDWNKENLLSKKSVIRNIFDIFEHLGYGIINSTFKKNMVLVSVEDSLSSEEKDNVMAKNICILYQGLFHGVMQELGIDVEGKEVKCYLLGDDACVFKYDLLVGEFNEEEPDEEETSTHITNFMRSL